MKHYAAFKKNKVDLYTFKLKNSSVWRIFYSKLLLVVIPGSGEGIFFASSFYNIASQKQYGYFHMEKKDNCKALTGLWWLNMTASEREEGSSWGHLGSLAGLPQEMGSHTGWLAEAQLGFGMLGVWGATPWWRCWGSLGAMVGALCS